MPKLFVLLISAMNVLSSIAFVHVHHIPHYVSRPVNVHPRPVHVHHRPKPAYSPVVYNSVYVNPFWIPLFMSSHTIRTVVKTVPVVETHVVEQPVVKQIVQQQVPEYNSNGLLLIQTNFVSGTSN